MNQLYQSPENTVIEVLQGQIKTGFTPMPEKTNDVGLEKHVPVITKTDSGIHVAVGSVPHPMEEAHFIQWIELITGKKQYRVWLSPGDKPEADFPHIEGAFTVRELCNIHGLWKVDVS